jgi:toxin ParE1/3/4
MKRLFSIHETAEIEINEAADFYDAGPLIRGRVRKKPLVKFPYSLIYSIRSDEFRLLAVAHQKRRPFYWRGRR